MPEKNTALARRISGRPLVVMTLTLLLFVFRQTQAQETKPQDSATLTPEPIAKTVVTATRTETPLENVGNATTVITRQQIEQSQSRTVGEALRDVPGVAIVQSGRTGGNTSVFLRGANSNQTHILINGARFNSPLNGLATLGNISTD